MFRYEHLSRKIGGSKQNYSQHMRFVSESVIFVECEKACKGQGDAYWRYSTVRRKGQRGESTKGKFE
jgi:hypothetical protein